MPNIQICVSPNMPSCKLSNGHVLVEIRLCDVINVQPLLCVEVGHVLVVDAINDVAIKVGLRV